MNYSYNYQTQNPMNRYYQNQIPGLVNQLKGSGSTLNSHLSSIMGNQRTQMDDYVKRAAGAGIQRGGMNVAGGSPLAGQLALQATKGLASQYSQNYNQAAQLSQNDQSVRDSRLQKLLSSMQYGTNTSGGYGQTWKPGATQTQQATTDDTGMSSRRQRLLQDRADREYNQQQSYQRQQRNQQIADANTQKIANQKANNQAIREGDRQTYLSNQQFNDQQRQRPQQLALQKKQTQLGITQADAQIQALQNSMNGSNGTGTSGTVDQNQGYTLGGTQGTGIGGAGAQRWKSKDEQNQELQRLYQSSERNQLLNSMAQANEQTKQSRLKTQQQQLGYSGDEYKQDAWRKAQNPYLQAMNSYLGLGGLGYGGMNNARMGQARTAADVWGGITNPSNRNYSWQTGVEAKTENQIARQYQYKL